MMIVLKHAVLLCALMTSVAPAVAQAPFALEVVAEGLSAPLFATAPAGDRRLFVVEQTGAIRIIEDGTALEAPFLDVSALVTSGGEQGLLGLAFHPDYAVNGRFFINYTDSAGDTQVIGYTVSSDPNVAEADSATRLFSVDQPRANHNGGWIGFGPDGLLYIGMGDGGGAGDRQGNAQNDASLLGKMLRLDADAGGEPEIFAKGLRNPWRNAFDGDLLYIADVGQGRWEEISVVSLDDEGANLGWNTMEGSECYPAGRNCDMAGLVRPVTAYTHDEGCSVTGGYVYRGAAIPAIEGHYFYADYCTGVLKSFVLPGDGAPDVVSYDDLGSLGQVTSFGIDSAGELYILTQDGTVRKFVPAQ